MKFKIIFFDCDGVLLFGFPLATLEKSLNINDEIYENLQKYHREEITFEDWRKIAEECYKLVNLKKDYFLNMMDLRNYQINPEAEELVKYLKDNKYEIVIISSGAKEYVSEVASKLGIKYFRWNSILNFDSEGNFKNLGAFGPDTDSKVTHINEICNELQINPLETIFIGDSDNDIKAFEFTKHGILYGDKRLDLQKHSWKNVSDLRDVIKILEDEE